MFKWLRRRQQPMKSIIADAAKMDQGAPYIVPATQAEDNRLDFQHQMLYRALGRNYLAPLTRPREILDVGCGTGRWVVEMAIQFPEANVTGIDITPVNVQRFLANLNPPPENFVFLQQDILQGIPYDANWFDFVHQRLLVGALPENAWPQLLQDLVRVTRPQGWIELAEPGAPTDKPGSAFIQLWDIWGKLSATRGIDLNAAPKIGDRLARAGLHHIQMERVIFPIGNHGGRFGHAFATDLLSLGKTLRGGVIHQNIVAADVYDRIYAQTEQEFSGGGQAVQPFYLAWGQKR